ncbi:MAG: class I SAM-dependent methyltransferase [Actinobacteria bacterium]|nr:MAG: class I SAM-dependent methyltransferase [Actinomycetota bacterium]
MGDLDTDLIAFYDQESDERSKRPLDVLRAARQTEFADRLTMEGCSSLLEVGVGPGRDAVEFIDGGVEVVGLDLSLNHARIASAAGVPSVQASLYSIPFASRTFHACWTMSTLLHVPDSRFDEAMQSVCAVLRPGALLAIGLWGGRDAEFVSEFDQIKPARFFSLRSHDRIAAMVGGHGSIELFDTWPHGANDWEYQFIVVRTTT